MSSRYDKYTTHHTSRRTDGWDYTQPAAYFVTICTQDRVCLFGTVEEGRMALNTLGRIVAEEWQRSETIRDRVHLDAFVVMPNHLHGIVVFADPEVEAPTCPRGYRAFGRGKSENQSQESDSEKASHGGAGGSTGPSNSKGASPRRSEGPSGRGMPNDETASHGGAGDSTDASDSQEASPRRSEGPSGRGMPKDETASHGGAGDSTDPSNSQEASTRRSTLGGDVANRPTGPPPRSLGSFIAGFKSAATARINDHRDASGAAVWQRNYHDIIIRDERHWQNARAYIRRNPTQWHADRLHRPPDP